MAGYHAAFINKGELGKFSKIKEEFLEAEDSYTQGNKVMLLIELADLMGAIEAYLGATYKGAITLDDLRIMQAATERAFKSGHRK